MADYRLVVLLLREKKPAEPVKNNSDAHASQLIPSGLYCYDNLIVAELNKH